MQEKQLWVASEKVCIYQLNSEPSKQHDSLDEKTLYQSYSMKYACPFGKMHLIVTND